ncbi:MAG: hypothetical protein HZB38_06955 [Planctomycetes bacterium]|nr:hypothetical protein [Planctomycetota bacterium]
MPLTRETRRIVNEWLAGVLCVSLLLAPMGGCPQNGDNTGDGGDSSTSSGLFINQDSSGNVLMAARGQDGAEFFVFGSRGANGGLEEVDSILVRTASDEEAFVTFESGRPVHAQGPDGSYCHIE